MTDDPAIGHGESPALVALRLRDRGQELFGPVGVDRKERQLAVAIEADDDTRRPAAEASAAVVEQHRARERAHRGEKRYEAATSGER